MSKAQLNLRLTKLVLQDCDFLAALAMLVARRANDGKHMDLSKAFQQVPVSEKDR